MMQGGMNIGNDPEMVPQMGAAEEANNPRHAKPLKPQVLDTLMATMVAPMVHRASASGRLDKNSPLGLLTEHFLQKGLFHQYPNGIISMGWEGGPGGDSGDSSGASADTGGGIGDATGTTSVSDSTSGMSADTSGLTGDPGSTPTSTAPISGGVVGDPTSLGATPGTASGIPGGDTSEGLAGLIKLAATDPMGPLATALRLGTDPSGRTFGATRATSSAPFGWGAFAKGAMTSAIPGASLIGGNVPSDPQDVANAIMSGIVSHGIGSAPGPGIGSVVNAVIGGLSAEAAAAGINAPGVANVGSQPGSTGETSAPGQAGSFGMATGPSGGMSAGTPTAGVSGTSPNVTGSPTGGGQNTIEDAYRRLIRSPGLRLFS